MQRNRFHVLLAALMLLIASGPIVQLVWAASHPFAARIVVTGAYFLVLLSAVLAVAQSRWTVIFAVGLAAPALVLKAIDLWLDVHAVVLTIQYLSMALLALTAILILRFVLHQDRITPNMISASLCVYLVLGMLWASAYTVIEIADPGSFHYAYADDDANDRMRFGEEDTDVPVYYSLVTLTTLGYGDIAPKTPMARMAASLEAVVGQLYLAVMVARLVGLHIAHATAGGGKRKRRA